MAHPFLKNRATEYGSEGGSLDGVEGVLSANNGQKGLVISIEGIQRSLAISIEGYDIEAL
jgi:hypothetical protein